MAVAPQDTLLAQLLRFNQLSNQQKLGYIIGLAAIIAVVAGAWMWSQTPDYRVLYTNLSDRDGGAIIGSLQQMNVPYKMAEGGGAILVPATHVYEVRLRLASQGLPKGSVVGFELMEGQKLGTSQFLEQVNYQRGLEGELTRSIQSLSAVQAARVHLAIPRPTVFIRDQQKPSASVLLSLGPGKTLDPAQVSGIVHLVASSVPELPVKNVTVVDQNGNLLSGAGENAASHAGLDPSQLDYLHQVEQSYAKRIESILTPIAGLGNVRAQVTAELDFSQVEQTAETFRPNPAPGEAAVRSQQTSETIGNAAGAPASGVPGALSNQPPGAASAPITAAGTPSAPGAAAAPGAGSNVHKEATLNYEVDKTIRHTRQPVGTVKRLAVAVVVNNRQVKDKAGKVTAKPLADTEMAQINNLVREAMGFSQARGDTLNVVNAAFSAGEAEELPPVPMWKDPANLAMAKEIARNLLIAGLVFYLVFGVLRPLLRELAKPPPMPKAPPPEAQAEVAAQAAAAGYEESVRAAKELAKQNPAAVANVVKDWVGRE